MVTMVENRRAHILNRTSEIRANVYRIREFTRSKVTKEHHKHVYPFTQRVIGFVIEVEKLLDDVNGLDSHVYEDVVKELDEAIYTLSIFNK